MALSSVLLDLKSAGTYRSERDLSTISNETTTYSNLRLVVGFSKKGPFNSPVLVKSQSEFINLFGNIDRSLEKKGSFFHRSALVALSVGPILALNLVNLDPDIDQVVEKSFSASMVKSNKNLVTLPLTSVYNTDKFWYASDESFLDAINVYLSSDTMKDKNADGSNSIISFTNIGKNPISILVKKASKISTKGYELTLNDWYGGENVPEYLNGTSYVSDYMVEVYVVSGDFGPSLNDPEGVPSSADIDGDGAETLKVYEESENPYARFKSDIVYQTYFDERGFIRKVNGSDTTDTNLAKFLKLPSVKVIAKYVGSLIPDFVDKMGRNIWIQKLVNDDTSVTGLLCTENIDLLENVNADNDVINEAIDLLGHNVHSIINNKDNEDKLFDFLSYKGSVKKIDNSFYLGNSDSDSELYFDDEMYYYVKDDTRNITVNGTLYYAWYCDELPSDADIDGRALTPVVFSDTEELGDFDGVYMDNGNGEPDKDKPSVTITKPDEFPINYPITKIIPYYTGTNRVFYTSSTGNEVYVPRDNEVVVNLSHSLTAGDHLLSYVSKGTDGEESYSRLTRVKESRVLYEKKEGKYVKSEYVRVICADNILKLPSYVKDGVNASDVVIEYRTVDEYCDRLQWVCLKGFKMRDDIMPNGTNERQDMILDMIRENTEYPSTKSNLFKALIDRDNIQFRYVVDTFGLGLEESCKDAYTKLCQSRKSALAIINCPSHKDFKQSKNPSFVNEGGSVEAQYIAEGGNVNKSPVYLFSLPSVEDGASWGAYYYPYLKISDLSAVKTVPPAAYVSNLYVTKYSRGNAWDIVAGQKRGVISGNQVIGVEATLVHDNRDWLEPAGINSIIWENGVGVEIYANKTAKQTPVSALSSIHVREAVIYIQDNIESILRRYVFEMNTAQTRMEIKTLVDSFLDTVKSNGGVYDYKTVMDTTNNTQEVIDNNMGVIDIYIEAVRGLEIIHQSLTILKTGSIASGDFS